MTLKIQYTPPTFTAADAVRLAAEWYGLNVSARPLPGERDLNFYLRCDPSPETDLAYDTAPNHENSFGGQPPAVGGREYVLKIAHTSEEAAALDLQNKAITHLNARAAGLSLPQVCPTLTGADMVAITGPGGEPHWLRLLTYVPGDLWAQANPHTPDMLFSLGQTLGQIDAALQEFDHPAAHRLLKWDLPHAGWIGDYLGYIESPQRRAIVESCLTRFGTEVKPQLPHLRHSIIYNDANDYNILVSADDPRQRRVIGVIDFGDLVYTQTLCELAIAAAYALMDKPDPLAAAAPLIAGYHQAFPLTEPELALLFPLICTRLCVTVTNAAYQRTVEPDNVYLTISERPAWALLEKLAAIPPQLAHYAFRHACGLPAHPAAPALAAWLTRNRPTFGRLVEPDLNAALLFDLSVGSLELGNVADFATPPMLTRRLFDRLSAANAPLGLGRYNEARPFYHHDLFKRETNDGPEWRTVHLGIDLFMAPGSPVFAPLPGVIHSLKNNAGPMDYGPTLVLQHTPADGPTFFTFYSHLSLDSLAPWSVGDAVEQGAKLGYLGDISVNGGWPPHLHFQIITDMLGYEGDFPGLAAPSQRELWLALCPDPGLMLPLPPPPAAMSVEDILTVRRQHVGRNLSISYRQPLKMVRGSGQFLYDDTGRPYLDTVNNVPHVGHNHPRVVQAGQAQMAVLNTNTRYLHENLVRYAERLCATLPEPLRVCYFVCSGSEANELALRLARTHTGQKDVIVVDVAYHGNTGLLVDISPYKHAGPGGKGAPPYVHVALMPDPYRGPYKLTDPQAGAKYAAHVAEITEGIQQTGGGVSAFICESILSCGGQIVLPEGYLPEVYRQVRAAGGVCIADEVQVGFGRVGSHFWAFETQGVVPDIVTMGKPTGNGHPLAAVVTTPEIAASFANGMEYFNTFGGNPVSCAIGLAVLDVIAEENLQAHALTVGNYLLAGLRRLMERHPIMGDVRGLGLFIGIELVLNRQTLEPAGEQAGYIANRMRDYGILMSTDGPFHNVLKIKPPLVFNQADADFLLATLDRILQEDFVRLAAS